MLKIMHGVINKKQLTTNIDLIGAFSFAGNQSSYIDITNNNNLNISINDFTIEWYQYQTDSNSFPRIFSIGSYDPYINLAVSIEGGIFYFWVNNSIATSVNLGVSSNYKNKWIHFAISRISNTLKIFKNGSQIVSTSNSSNVINDLSKTLTIGNESVKSLNTSFGGYITNFNIVVGQGKYSSNFESHKQPLESTVNTKLLLLATDSNSLNNDSSEINNVIQNYNVSWADFNYPIMP
jgi:hypothetical protein